MPTNSLDYNREYHRRMPAAKRAAKALRRGNRRKEIAASVAAAKSSPCLDCGVSYPACVMDFDHRPGEEKKFNVSTQVRSGASLSLIMAEIAKCDLVCSNCHRLRTARRNEYQCVAQPG